MKPETLMELALVGWLFICGMSLILPDLTKDPYAFWALGFLFGIASTLLIIFWRLLK